MNRITRRKTLKILTAAPLAAGFSWTESEAHHAQARLIESRETEDGTLAPQFFTEREFKTVQVLVDYILPADERSGSATEAGVHEFIDFMMIDRPERQTAIRGGLAWMDVECQKLFGKAFMDCTESEQRQLLDDVAWPDVAHLEMSHGVAFFNSFRDLTATGFWTSKMGIEDLQYIGNKFVGEWNGCPQETLDRLGVSYKDA